MKENNKIIKISLLLLVTFIVINLNIISKANTNEIVMPDESEYSYEYKKWLALPDDEKENYIMPPMYTINLEENQDTSEISLFNINASANNQTIPSKYNLTDTINLPVRDQGITDSCWAISSVEMFETTYAKLNNLNRIKQYSSRHIDYATSKYFLNNVENLHGFNRRVGEGCNYEVGMAYFTSGKGPISENDMPFKNNKDLITISEIQNKKVQAQLRDYTEYPNIYKSYDANNNVTYSNGNGLNYTKQQIDSFRNNIKKQIMNYGAIGTYTYSPTSPKSTYNYFSKETEGNIYGNSYFCNNTSLNVNHSVCIVGWDDDYSKDNFKEGCKPANDGAYIILGSWGTEWNSENGYYYISYDDYFVELLMYGIQDVSDINYDNIYQYDELGNNYSIYSQYDASNIYGANIFEKTTNSKEKLTDVGLYIYNDNTNVTIYISESSNNLDVTKLKTIATASNLTAGYHTIKINTEPIILNNTFSIIVKYNNNSAIARLPIEANYSSLGKTTKQRYNTATSNPGESFYSLDGIEWKDLYDLNPDMNICIKALTVNLSGDIDNTNYIKNTNWKLSNGKNVIMLSGIEEKTTISNLLSTNNFSSNCTAKAYQNGTEVTSGIVTTGTIIKIYEGEKEVQQYSIVIYGDTTGDGIIASIDALAIVKNNLGKELFSNEIYEEAGRVLKDKRISKKTPSAVDALACVKYKLGIGTISQY